MMDSFGGHGWGMGWGWFIGLFFLAAIIWFVVRTVNQNRSTNQFGSKSAPDILKERYARGEIDKKEFDERKKGLM